MNMTSTALAPQHPPSSRGSDSSAAADSLHQRMDQFFNINNSAMAAAAAAAAAAAVAQQQQQQQQQQQHRNDDGSSSRPGDWIHPPNAGNGRTSDGDPYGSSYQEASATSGSNSGEDDDQMDSGSNGAKRSLGDMNLAASKKRRKQSKPIRLTGGENENQGAEDSGHGGDEEDRRYSTEDGGEEENDGPLNLSSESSSLREPGEKERSGPGGNLRVLGPELMNSALENGELMSKLQSLPQSSLYQAAAAAGGMLNPFGLNPFPFPFPTSKGMPNGGIPHPITTTAGNMRGGQIFNPEAYCELCNKEFCNKYFLKTHKANKHGIYSDPIEGSSSSSGRGSNSNNNNNNGTNNDGRSSSVPSTQQLVPPSSTLENHLSAKGPSSTPNSHNSGSGSPFSGAFIAANMGSLRPPFLPLSPGGQTSHDSPSPAGPTTTKDNDLSRSDDRQSSPNARSIISPHHEKENGEIRRSLESPLSGAGGRVGPSSGLHPLMFGSGGPGVGQMASLEALRKQEQELLMGKDRHIPNIPNLAGGAHHLAKNGAFSQDKLRSMGVINADAFCEICCKEFCNKYFLRVHKLKKHGICSPDLPPEKVQKILSQMAKEAGKNGNPPLPPPPPPVVRPGPPTSTSSTASGGPLQPSKSPRPPSGLLPLPIMDPMGSNKPLMPTMSSSDKEVIKIMDDGNDDESFHSNDANGKEQGEVADRREQSLKAGDAAASEDLQRLQSMIMELNSNKAKQLGNEDTTICKVCNKDMENKYFLRAHMMNEHGILHMEEPPQIPIGMEKLPSSSPKPDDTIPFPLPNGIMGDKPMDITAKFLQQMTKGLQQPGEDERAYLERIKNELISGLSPKKYDKDPNRRPASLSRSYCEICKKELCNKYFMKTHMMKMHGINIEAGNTTGVSCHICKKELCSKYFLKVHLQNSHGITDDSSTSPNSALKEASERNGSAPSSLFPALFPPPSLEMMGLSGSERDQYFSRLFGEQSELSRERLMELEKQKMKIMENGSRGGGPSPPPSSDNDVIHNCSLCGEEFGEIVALQVHIIKSHGAFPPESGLFGSKEGGGGDSGKETEEEGEVAHHRPSPSTPTPSSLLPQQTSSATTTAAGGGAPEEREVDPHEQDNKSSSAESSSNDHIPPKLNQSSHHQEDKNESNEINNPAASPPPSSEKRPGSGFPNIEMLQRHMFSQQFPGLMNPLLSGFSGFSGSPGSLPFPLQKLLSNSAANLNCTPPPPEMPRRHDDDITPPPSSSTLDKDDGLTASTNKSSSKKGKRRFKCSKCSQKFKRRELCLQHIQDHHHSNFPRRKLHFSSPHKSTKSAKNRSEYVRQLMELLKVPTSRGTPTRGSTDSPISRSSDGGPANGHIMQPFLLKTPQETTSMDFDNKKSSNCDKNFVPSLVYLPVSRRVSGPMTVAFNLIPA